MRKFLVKLFDRVKRYFSPTIEDALREFGIGESSRCSSKGLKELRTLIEEYEKEILTK